MKKIDKNDNEIIDWVFFMKKHVTISEEKSSSERALVFGARVLTARGDAHALLTGREVWSTRVQTLAVHGYDPMPEHGHLRRRVLD